MKILPIGKLVKSVKLNINRMLHLRVQKLTNWMTQSIQTKQEHHFMI